MTVEAPANPISQQRHPEGGIGPDGITSGRDKIVPPADSRTVPGIRIAAEKLTASIHITDLRAGVPATFSPRSIGEKPRTQPAKEPLWTPTSADLRSENPYTRDATMKKVLEVYGSELKGRALQLTRNPADAEDLLQETLLRVFIKAEHFQADTNFAAWADRILTTTFINRYRKKGREPHTVGGEIFDDVMGRTGDSGGSSPKTEVDYLPGLQRRLVAAGISNDIANAVILFDALGLPYYQIASVLDIPIGTVQSRIHRGRAQLREIFESAPDKILLSEDPAKEVRAAQIGARRVLHKMGRRVTGRPETAGNK